MKLRNKVRVYWGWIEQLQFFYFLQTCLLLNHFCYYFFKFNVKTSCVGAIETVCLRYRIIYT